MQTFQLGGALSSIRCNDFCPPPSVSFTVCDSQGTRPLDSETGQVQKLCFKTDFFKRKTMRISIFLGGVGYLTLFVLCMMVVI